MLSYQYGPTFLKNALSMPHRGQTWFYYGAPYNPLGIGYAYFTYVKSLNEWYSEN